ncbi:MAG: hypothetical protein LBB62_00415, partial [Proteiniphilum sp.]|nr:hypothetical protein [Proteiniphilum sp.]
LICKDLARWSFGQNPYTPEQTSLLKTIADIFSDAWHISLPDDKLFILTSYDYSTLVTVIRSLRKRVGLAELAVAILIALIIDHRLYSDTCRSPSEFFHRNGETMGISPSSTRDYYKRGIAFLRYRKDILEGVDDIPGIPLNEFVSHHMSKLTLYERAVAKLGRKEALWNLKLTFREFQKMLSTKNPTNKKPLKTLPEKNLSANSISPREIIHEVHETQKKMILDLNLAPNEKRLLRIIAKNGIIYIIKKLTEEQVNLLETRLHQRRLQVFERNLKCVPLGAPNNSIDPLNPLAISDELYSLTNIDEIILRIRASIALVAPARRTIAIMVFRLYSERPQWKHPRNGVDYSSFRDFAMEELGLGEDYRDYIAVGRVLKDYYYFLDGLSDIETEDVFLKLRHLPDALKTHKGNEPLVLARLRSLSVREFKLFSLEPDFEILFSKKLTKKQLDKFFEWLNRTRPLFHSVVPCNTSIDFIEIYHRTEDNLIEKTMREIIEETEPSAAFTLPPPVSSSGLTDADISHQVLNLPMV